MLLTLADLYIFGLPVCSTGMEFTTGDVNLAINIQKPEWIVHSNDYLGLYVFSSDVYMAH